MNLFSTVEFASIGSDSDFLHVRVNQRWHRLLTHMRRSSLACYRHGDTHTYLNTTIEIHRQNTQYFHSYVSMWNSFCHHVHVSWTSVALADIDRIHYIFWQIFSSSYLQMHHIYFLLLKKRPCVANRGLIVVCNNITNCIDNVLVYNWFIPAVMKIYETQMEMPTCIHGKWNYMNAST